jgi:hypothetical protein
MGEPYPLATAYTIAVATEHARADDGASGYRLYWMCSGRFGSCDVPIDPQSFLVAGRHAFCDVVLDADPTIALRHLLIRATRLDDGCPRLSVLDLHTNIGFAVHGGNHERSIAATGPIAFHVGVYAVVALPIGERLPEALPEPLCERALIAHPYRDAAPSSMTLLPPALGIGESFDKHASYALSLRSMHGAAGIQLSPLDLEVGVLVGRAPKCSDTLRSVLNDGISRVHVLIRKGIVYDLASTQGTYLPNPAGGWRRIRSTGFEHDTQVCIGAATAVHLRFVKLDA